MPALNAIIAEDEKLLREDLASLLENVWPDLNIIGLAKNGEEALALLQENQVDIAFLDIKMPGKTGLDVASQAGPECRVVFITGYDQYAIKAFEAGAVDYLLKPITLKRLSQAVERLKKQTTKPPLNIQAVLESLQAGLTPPQKYLQWVNASRGEEVFLIPVEEVLYFQANEKYTSVHTKKEEWLIRTTIKELEDTLNPEKFWRIHRGILVQVEAISHVSRDFKGSLGLSLTGHPARLPVSKPFVNLFKQM